MCGIAGTFCYAGASRVDHDRLLRMRDRMSARGPDSAGLWVSPDQRIGLAQRRLAIIDLSPGGAQPMFSADRRVAIVFNGEIYNYPEIRKRLEAKGVHFRSNSDTEAILHLYREKGDEMTDEMRGMYTFILWDEEKQGVLLGRDPFGIKPLYIFDDGKTLHAASQVKALLAEGSFSPSLEPAGHAGFFLWGHIPEPFTLYKNIRMLPAGSTLWVDSGGHKRTRHFQDIRAQLLNLGQIPAELNGHAGEALGSALVDTVKHHLLADVPVGVFLSAGLDSSVLASAATSALGKGSLRTITLGFEEYKDSPADETILAGVTAKSFQTVHQTKWISARDFGASLDHLFYSMDQPSIDGVNTYFVSKVTAESGLKVALSGLGGDELFGSYPSFQQIPKMLRTFGFARHLPKPFTRGMRWLGSPLAARWATPKHAGLLEYGATPAGAYLLMRGMYMPWELPGLLDPDLARQGLTDLATCDRLAETSDGFHNDRLLVSALELNWYMRNQLLRDSDWAGMAHSIEIRVPMVDIELLRRLTPILASTHPPSKRDMALASPLPLPPEVLNRAKTGFNVPIHQWLLESAGAPKSSDPVTAGTGPGRGRLREWAKVVYRQCSEHL